MVYVQPGGARLQAFKGEAPIHAWFQFTFIDSVGVRTVIFQVFLLNLCQGCPHPQSQRTGLRLFQSPRSLRLPPSRSSQPSDRPAPFQRNPLDPTPAETRAAAESSTHARRTTTRMAVSSRDSTITGMAEEDKEEMRMTFGCGRAELSKPPNPEPTLNPKP
jgi:hypothetical protein